tara:strand:+ start:1371 stop:1547 length:177 start_codon:yes stop_codon:yes gene_type:complete
MINTVTKVYDEGKLQSYKVTYVNSNVSRSVPLVEANTDYQAIQEWAEIEGNNIIDPGA